MGYDEATSVHFKNHQSSQGEIESKFYPTEFRFFIFQLEKVFQAIPEISFSHEFIEFDNLSDKSIFYRIFKSTEWIDSPNRSIE